VSGLCGDLQQTDTQRCQLNGLVIEKRRAAGIDHQKDRLGTATGLYVGLRQLRLDGSRS
jgi:hypothetical protein